jgi:DNA-binding beta-propeller fold protein YncE
MRTGANSKSRRCLRPIMLLVAMIVITAASTRMQANQTGTCGGQSTTIPFDDVLPGNIFFCSIAEAFFSGLTNGTDATHYSPSANVSREQMAAFITRTMDQSLKRGSKRAALNQNWTTQGANHLALTTVGTNPTFVQSDGEDLWVSNRGSDNVMQVHASNGKVLGTWTGATKAEGVLVARGKIFVTGKTDPGQLYQIDPTLPPGAVTTLASNLGPNSEGIAYDGQRLWVANPGTFIPGTGSLSMITLNPTFVITLTGGFFGPYGVIYDGANIWVTDSGDDKLKKLDSNGTIILSVDMGTDPLLPAFDGTNIWVPNQTSHSVTVVRATGALSGTVLATLTGNGLDDPHQAAFDGERIMIANLNDSVSLWKASDLTPIGTFSTGANTLPSGVCSDGLNFWITLFLTGKVARF